mmetsp:Transcript_8255/g.12698  ORF Transcript_8255/g.12698 Transcript_8255/m.12698 type:complete len:210 (+) Transcript_8255:122-751(+)
MLKLGLLFTTSFFLLLINVEAFSSTSTTKASFSRCTSTCLSMGSNSPCAGELPTLIERRSFIALSSLTGLALGISPAPAQAAGKDTVDAMIAELAEVKKKLEPIPGLLQAQDWEAVRTILKSPPVNLIWNVGVEKNTLARLADLTDNVELLELKDDLALSLQMCDQFTYDNVFVYFQPGNGKVKVKEPTELANKAMKQIDDAIRMAQET